MQITSASFLTSASTSSLISLTEVSHAFASPLKRSHVAALAAHEFDSDISTTRIRAGATGAIPIGAPLLRRTVFLDIAPELAAFFDVVDFPELVPVDKLVGTACSGR